jgi:hypothetical protein
MLIRVANLYLNHVKEEMLVGINLIKSKKLIIK